MTEGRWILLAEDNANDADLALRALAAHQVPSSVVLVADGVEALDCLYRRGAFRGHDPGLPAVVLLGLKMPKVDGLEVLRQIKNDAALKHIPVVVFTSSREGADLTRTYQLGVNSYVVKPLGFQEFVATLKDVRSFWLTISELPPVASTPGTGPPVQLAQPEPAQAV